MKITYLGTGAAAGIPALFCNCEYCRGARARGGREIRSRAQTLIDGELSLDFPPDCFYHSALLGADLSAVKYLLVTHSHMDHFYAHDFILRGYKYARNMTAPALEIFGNEEVAEVFAECTRRELRSDVAAHIAVRVVEKFTPFLFGKYTAVALPARHTSKEPFVYLVEKGGKRVLHLCDTGLLPEETYEYLSGIETPVDLITLDCTFLREESDTPRRHMGLEDNKKTLRRLEEMGLANAHTKKVITHFSHNAAPSPQSLRRAEEEYGYIAAYDGMSLDI